MVLSAFSAMLYGWIVVGTAFMGPGRFNGKGSTMGIIAWLVLGLIAGFIASKLYAGSGQGALMDIVLGIVGAFVGGFLFSFFGASPVNGFNIYSLIVAVVGAVVVLWLYHTLTGRRSV